MIAGSLLNQARSFQTILTTEGHSYPIAGYACELSLSRVPRLSERTSLRYQTSVGHSERNCAGLSK
jgi:hypothetical protein